MEDIVSKTKNDGQGRPYANRGVTDTSEEHLRACVDWAEITLKNYDFTQVISNILLMDVSDFNHANGKYGYSESVRNGNISVYFGGRDDMGVHIEMTGKGCRQYESIHGDGWGVLFKRVIEHGGTFSRLDVAIDDFYGYFNVKSMVRKVKRQELVSRFKKGCHIEDLNLNTGDVMGVTLYFGSSKSDVQVRMYDKLWERKIKDDSAVEDIDFWNRTEIQLRDDRALLVAKEIVSSDSQVGHVVCRILRHYLRFVTKGSDSNRSRWKTSTFWNKFLGDVDPLPLTIVPEEKTVDDIERWILSQVSKPIYMVHKSLGDDWMDKLLKTGLSKIGPQDEKIMRSYEAKEKTSIAGNNESPKVFY